MMKLLKSKRLILALLSAALVLVIAAGGTAAYLTTKTGEQTNVFTPADNIRARLNEPNWDQAEALKMVPGKEVRKDPMITNTGQTAEYTALRLTFRYDDGTVMSQADLIRLLNLINVTWNPGWTLCSGSITRDGTGKVTAITQPLVYYYNKVLSPGQVSDPIFSSVSAKTASDGITEADLRWLQAVKIVNGNTVPDPTGLGAFHIGVEGAAVQALGYNTAADAASTLIALFP